MDKKIIARETVSIWKEREISLRKDKIGRELFKELLKQSYYNLIKK